jgi:hypothetical protein
MPAYLVAEIEITNSAGLEPYRAAVGATITQYGGRFLVRGGTTELVEGGTGTQNNRSPGIPRRRSFEALVCAEIERIDPSRARGSRCLSHQVEERARYVPISWLVRSFAQVETRA